MAISKFVIFSIFLTLIFSPTLADVSVGGEEFEPSEAVGSKGPNVPALKIELDQLKSKIRVLESKADEKTQELKRKNDLIAEKEKIIQDKSDSISLLQSEIDSLKKKGPLDAAEQVGKAHARAGELEKLVERLHKEVETQKKEKQAVQVRASESEKKTKELGSKVENLQKVNDEHKTKIHKIERALKVAEEEMMKAKFEATSRSKDLLEVHGSWFPPWLAAHLVYAQSFLETQWNQHGKPTMDIAMQKALEKKAQAEKWAEPHVETIKTKWIPSIKYLLLEVRTSVEPHMKSLKIKSIEVYETSKSALVPHIVKVQEVVDPYFQQAKKYSKPYVDQAATVAKPYVAKVQEVLKPYSKKIVKAYGKFLKSATAYHQQVQAAVKEKLIRHELTKPFAIKELEWFTASAILALPIIIAFKIISSLARRVRNLPEVLTQTMHLVNIKGGTLDFITYLLNICNEEYRSNAFSQLNFGFEDAFR